MAGLAARNAARLGVAGLIASIMPDHVIFDHSYGTVRVAPADCCLLVEWHGFANAADFIALQEAVLAYFEAHSTPARPWGVVGDTRHMGAIPVKAQEWLVAEFNPRMVAAGLREMSVVVSENVFGQLATQRYVQQSAQAHDRYHLRTAFYESSEAARVGARAARVGG